MDGLLLGTCIKLLLWYEIKVLSSVSTEHLLVYLLNLLQSVLESSNAVASNLKSLLLNSNQIKLAKQYRSVVLLVMFYKTVLTFKSVYEILKCDHSNESY